MSIKEVFKVVKKVLMFVFGVYLLALTYNMFFLPNNIVIGGTSGLSIIFRNKINPEIFIYVSTFALLLVSYLVLGVEQSNKTLLGSILYPVFITLSAPVAEWLITYVQFDEMLSRIIAAALFYGLSNGIIFRTGHTTGGFDVIANIITKYFKIPQGKALFYANFLVIVSGAFVYDFKVALYALVILYVGSLITNKLVIGISESKIFFIYTRKVEKIKDMIANDLNAGCTVMPTKGGYTEAKGELIMCVLPTRSYYVLKEKILKIDKKAFIVVNDCYDVNGGFQQENILDF